MNEFQKTTQNENETQHSDSFNYEIFAQLFNDFKKMIKMYLTK